MLIQTYELLCWPEYWVRGIREMTWLKLNTLVLLRSWFQSPEPTWQFTTICDSSFRRCKTFFCPSQALGSHLINTYMYRQNAHTKKHANLSKQKNKITYIVMHGLRYCLFINLLLCSCILKVLTEFLWVPNRQISSSYEVWLYWEKIDIKHRNL